MNFKTLFGVVSFLFINLIMMNAYAAKPIMCSQQYALCTSARCIPDPRHPNYAICHCDVQNGLSAGYKSCAERAPSHNKFNGDQVVSTFSFEQFAAKKFLTCPKGSAWTNCLDEPCTVDPKNPKSAICSCVIDNTQAFATLGGDCNTHTCNVGFWSGATEADAKELRTALSEGMKGSNIPDAAMCSTSQ